MEVFLHKVVVPMISVQSYVRQGRHALRRWALDPRIHTALLSGAYVLSGFCLSAASLGSSAMPLALCLTCACARWQAVLAALGGSAGYLLLWGHAGDQCVAWLACGLVLTLLLERLPVSRQAPLLMPAAAALVVAAWGVIYQSVWADSTPVPIYLLRVGLAAGGTWLAQAVLQGRNPILDWLACGLCVLALAQLVPIPYLALGYIAAGMLITAAPFPAAAMAGLALDLAQLTPVPMTAVAACAALVRFLPHYRKAVGALAPAVVYITVMSLCGKLDIQPLPGLLLGGVIGTLLPAPAGTGHRRGETGVAQVRLELAAGVLAQTEQLLLELPLVPVDEAALVSRAAERACGSCPCRKTCKDSKRIAQLPGLVLHKPLLGPEEIPIVCRKSGRFLAELHRSQEQLRSIRADRERQREYRAAVMQQYRFLGQFLQELSDRLSRRVTDGGVLYAPEVYIYGNRPEADNGDRCLRFAGVGCRYYVLLCDGMGTGLGAVQEGKTAASMLRRLLTAGYPAEHALRSLNSLCALRERAGAVTVDLVELQLDSGKAALYKWGAAPSYLLGPTGVEKLGAASPPPGLSVTDCQEITEKLRLHRQQLLVLVSDGIPEEEALRCCLDAGTCGPGELAARLLSGAQLQSIDDATVVTVRLNEAGF